MASDVISPDTTFRLRLGASSSAINLNPGTTLIVETDSPAANPSNVPGIYDVQVIYVPDNRVIFDLNVEVK